MDYLLSSLMGMNALGRLEQAAVDFCDGVLSFFDLQATNCPPDACSVLLIEAARACSSILTDGTHPNDEETWQQPRHASKGLIYSIFSASFRFMARVAWWARGHTLDTLAWLANKRGAYPVS